MRAEFDGFPVNGLLPKKETEALQFLTKYPNYDGKNVIIAILDTGVDPGAPGLQFTSHGDHKIVDLIDATGAGDVDISTIKEVDSNNCIVGLSERSLKIPSKWSNPSGKYHLGLKSGFELFPSGLKERMRRERKDKLWSKAHENTLAEAQKLLNDFEADESNKTSKNFNVNQLKDELKTRVEILKDLENKIKDCGPVYDCLVWCDQNGDWCACVDTSERGELSECKVLRNYRDSHEYGTFTHVDMLNYSVRIIPEENLLQIVTDCGSHGTHVAGITSAYFENNCDLNGVAPGAQIVGIKIGDNRLNGMETNYALVNAFHFIIENKCHMINLSFGEPVSFAQMGPALSGFQELIDKHGLIVCISAGNNGPGIETVGAPGGYLSSMISVGAYVTSDMIRAEHSLLGTQMRSMLFTWSSRGPSIDGSLGVNLCAPGGAFASVPNWCLRGSQLMSGTSMASPNCCGTIALLLSALIDKKIEFNPYGLQRALENTAAEVDEQLGTGAGLIQIEKAYDYVIKKVEDELLSKITFDVKCGPKQTRGIYLRNELEVTQCKDYQINIEPKFFTQYEDETKFFRVQQDKIALQMRLALVVSEPWIDCPPHLYMVNSQRSFFIRIHADQLQENNVYFTQIKAYNLDNESKTCVFKIPIAIIKPYTFDSTKKNHNFEIIYKSVSFKQGQINRHFIRVPQGATHGEINLKCDEDESRDHAPLFAVQTFTLENMCSYSDSEKDDYFRLNSLNSFQSLFKCKSNTIIQVCICKNWSSLNQLNVNYSIKFNGIHPNTNQLPAIHCSSAEPYRIDLSCLRPSEDLEPCITYKYLIQPLRPSDSQIELHKSFYAEAKSIYQLVLTYNFNQAKSGEVCFEVPLLSNYLYENVYQSVFWMLFDSNKRLLLSGDAFPFHYKYSRTIEKGDYTVRLHLRHERMESLEKLKNLSLHLRHSISSLSQDIYTSYAALMKGNKKSSWSGEILLSGEKYSLILDKIADDKLPTNALAGNFLKGSLSFYKDTQKRDVDKYDIVYEINDLPLKKSISNKSNNDEKMSDEEKYSDALRNLKLSWITKSSEICQKLIEESPDLKNQIQYYVNRIKYLESKIDDTNKQTTYEQIFELSKQGIEKIDQNELLKYFGAKRVEPIDEKLKKEMDNLKSNLIDLLVYQGVALMALNNVENKDTLIDIYQSIQKWIDISDDKISKFLLKFYLLNGYYAKALKILFKQQEDKTSTSNDKQILDILAKLKLDYAIYFYENDYIMKYPKTYAKF